MLTTIFKAYYFVCLMFYEIVLFAPHARRIKGSALVENRVRSWDAPWAILAFFGMQLLPCVYVLTPWLRFADVGLPPWLGWLGVPTFACSLWLTWRAHVDLGRNWTPALQIKQGQSLVTAGVYRHVRHPIYAAQWLWAIAQALLLHNWLVGPLGLLSFAPVFFYRVPHEEQMMLEHFGDEYRAYMARTGRVIPRLGR